MLQSYESAHGCSSCRSGTSVEAPVHNSLLLLLGILALTLNINLKLIKKDENTCDHLSF